MSIKPVPITTKGFGTMSMTWTPKPQPFEKSIETLKYVKQKYGVKFFNCGDFYQSDPNFHNLDLISQFLKAEEDSGDSIISIKTGVDNSKEFLDECIAGILKWFKDINPKPKIIIESARVDPNVPIEDTMKLFLDYIKAGEFDGISLSEVGAKSIARAVSVAPISGIEVEVSLFSQDVFHNGVLAEASKHGIPIVAYSSLSRGILTDYAAEHDDFLGSLSDNDVRKGHWDRFKPENYEKNKDRLTKLYKFAKSKNISLECLAISYLESLSGLENFQGIQKITQVIPIPSGSTKDKIDNNFTTIKLTRGDMDALHEIIDSTQIHGYRYNAAVESALYA